MKLNLLSQQMGFKFKEEKKKREIKCYIWSIALYGVKLETLESRSEIPWKFWNMVLEKGGGDQLDRSCEKWKEYYVE